MHVGTRCGHEDCASCQCPPRPSTSDDVLKGQRDGVTYLGVSPGHPPLQLQCLFGGYTKNQHGLPLRRADLAQHLSVTNGGQRCAIWSHLWGAHVWWQLGYLGPLLLWRGQGLLPLTPAPHGAGLCQHHFVKAC